MSHSSYTASERRGIIIIAIISLLLVGAGLGVSFCNRNVVPADKYPIIETHPEMVDSVTVLNEKDQLKTDKKTKKNKAGNSTKKKDVKTYRRRSPLDEPV